MNAAQRAQAALDALADALISGDPDRVLANEHALSAAATDLCLLATTGVKPSSMGETLLLRAEFRAVRASLDRCRALGASAASLSAALYSAPTGYSASGTLQAAPASVLYFPAASYAASSTSSTGT